MDNKTEFLTTSDVAKWLCLTPARIRQLSNNGTLPATRTHSGQRLFNREDVERLIASRVTEGIHLRSWDKMKHFLGRREDS
jgi:excisionase family DNA binding protein